MIDDMTVSQHLTLLRTQYLTRAGLIFQNQGKNSKKRSQFSKIVKNPSLNKIQNLTETPQNQNLSATLSKFSSKKKFKQKTSLKSKILKKI